MHYDLIQRTVIMETFTRKKSYKKCHSPFKIKNTMTILENSFPVTEVIVITYFLKRNIRQYWDAIESIST
jgi:hypothetical protein